MLSFEQPVQNPRLLRRAVRTARKEKDGIPSLSELAPKRSLQDLTELARSWQKAGLGSLIEVSEEGRRSVLFSLNDDAVAKVDAEYSRSVMGRLSSLSRSEWIALLALLVSFIALFKKS